LGARERGGGGHGGTTQICLSSTPTPAQKPKPGAESVNEQGGGVGE